MTGKLKAWCELVRLPNVFTTAGDVLAGYWLACGGLEFSWRLGGTLAASACLYSAGIVLNDIADIETDRGERPRRPLPSGRIALRIAWRLMYTLLIAGLALAVACGWRTGAAAGAAGLVSETALLAGCLILVILAYDLLLKETPLGPPLMGGCRAINLILGMSAAEPLGASLPDQAMAPIALFVYITSVTWFGREEAGRSRSTRLVTGLAGIVLALLLQGLYVAFSLAEDWFALVLWLGLLIHVGRVCRRAVRRPEAPQVQYAMKTLILGLIAFDAVFATAAAGWQGGAIVLGLLIPALSLGRWIYST